MRYDQGEFSEARTDAERAIEHAREAGDAWATALYEGWLAMILVATGDYGRAQEIGQTALAKAPELGLSQEFTEPIEAAVAQASGALRCRRSNRKRRSGPKPP
jgi:hypothetical protein